MMNAYLPNRVTSMMKKTRSKSTTYFRELTKSLQHYQVLKLFQTPHLYTYS